MNSNKSNKSFSLYDCFEISVIILIMLKLIGVIKWSWLLVLCPVWITVLLTIGFVIIISIVDIRTRNKTWKSERIKW